MANREILIEVNIDAGASAEKLAEVRYNIDAVKTAQKDLQAQEKKLTATIREQGSATADQAAQLKRIAAQMATNSADLKSLQAQEKMYSSQIAASTQGNRKYGDSITEMGAQLAQLKQEYRGLSAAQREGAEGQALLKSIADLDSEVKKLDASMGDHQRNVGNYQSALQGLNGGAARVASLFQNGFRAGIENAGASVRAFSKTLLATPLGWISTIIRAVTVALNYLRDAFRANDDASTEMGAALAVLQPVMTKIREAFAEVAEVAAKVVSSIMGVVNAIASRLVPSYREAAAAAAELVQAQDALEDKQREYTLHSAERANEIAKIQKKIADNEGMSAEEREKNYQKIDEIQKKDLEEKKRIAAENYRILQERAKEEADTSDAMKDALVSARAEMIRAETEYLNATTTASRRAAAARKEQAREEAARVKAEKDAAKQRLQAAREAAAARKKIEEEELQRLEDLANSMIADPLEAARAAINTQYDRQAADIQKKLESEKNLTEAARRALTDQLVLLEQQRAQKLAEIDDKEIAEKAEKIKKADEETLKRAQEAAKAEAEARTAAYTLAREAYEEDSQKLANDIQERLAAVYGNAEAAAEIELQAAEQARERLLSLDDATKNALYKNEEAYRAAVLSSEQQIRDAREKALEAQRKSAEEMSQTMQAVTGALSDLLEVAAGDSEKFEKYKKAIAIVDASISMAQTIAKAVSVSMEGDPYTLAIRIAANVAAVTAQFAAVIKAIKAAQIPSAGSYEFGGIVPGTSYTGDNLTARVNSGEMIIPRDRQQVLWDLIKSGAPMRGADYEAIRAAIIEGMRQSPAPILDYAEFTAFAKKIQMYNNISRQ